MGVVQPIGTGINVGLEKVLVFFLGELTSKYLKVSNVAIAVASALDFTDHRALAIICFVAMLMRS
jgi:hypothetical protein